MDIGTVAVSAVSGIAGAILVAMVGRPFMQFWDMRGKIALALNSCDDGMRPGKDADKSDLVKALQHMSQGNRALAATGDFNKLGLELKSLCQHETALRFVLPLIGMRAADAAYSLGELARATFEPKHAIEIMRDVRKSLKL